MNEIQPQVVNATESLITPSLLKNTITTESAQNADPVSEKDILLLQDIDDKKGGLAVFENETQEEGGDSKLNEIKQRSENVPISFEEQYTEFVARGEKTGRDVDLDLDVLEYRSKDGKLMLVDPNNLNKETIVAVKNYVLALEIAKLDPKTATLPELIKGLTGFNMEEHDQILAYLRSVHPLIHDLYGLPSDALNTDGNRQQYVNELKNKIASRNVVIEFGPTPSGTAACFLPINNEKKAIISPEPEEKIKKNRGKIILDPEKIDITKGIEVVHALGHEFVHVLQWDPSIDRAGRLTNLAVMEFDANVGPYVIDESTDWLFVENLFKETLNSLKKGECNINQAPNPSVINNGPATLLFQ